MNANEFIDRLTLMFSMSVWDRHGHQWLPIWGYEGQGIVAYAPALDAIKAINQEVAWPD
jgi:hypothetical protein